MPPFEHTAATESALPVEQRLEEALFPDADSELETDAKPQPANSNEESTDEEEDAPETEKDELEEDSEDEEEPTGEDADDDSLSLADYLGVPEDRLIEGENGELKLLAKVDGEMSEVDLKDLVKSYQLERHVNNKSMALEDERKGFEEQRQEAVTELREYSDKLTALSKVMEQELLEQFQSVNWDSLRANNPAEWSAKREEFAIRANTVQRKQQELMGAVSQLQEQQKQEFSQQRETMMKTRDKDLLEAFPEWTDEVVRDRSLNDLGKFLSDTYGMPEETIENTLDAKAIKLAMDAKAFRESKSSAAAKKSVKIPKFQKSGAAKASAANAAKARQAKGKKQALKKSGSVNDAASLLIDRI